MSAPGLGLMSTLGLVNTLGPNRLAWSDNHSWTYERMGINEHDYELCSHERIGIMNMNSTGAVGLGTNA